MPLGPHAVEALYTTRIDDYESFVSIFRSPQGMRALPRHSKLVRPGLRVLDAGCGFGMVTLAFLDVLRETASDYESIDAFDLTPAMLHRFELTIKARGLTRIRLQLGDVLALERLPVSWTDYDLISPLRCSNTSRDTLFRVPLGDCVRVSRQTAASWW